MARPWRLRHKLALGMALVVASVLLILGGALFGLSSSVETMHVTRSKFDEVNVVVQLRDHIHNLAALRLDSARRLDIDEERREIERELGHARAAIAQYRKQLNDVADAEVADNELHLAGRIEAGLTNFALAVESAGGPGIDSKPTSGILEHDKVVAALRALNTDATNLFLAPSDRVRQAIERANANYRRSLTVAGSATVLALVLVVTLLYYFRVWVFTPIRAIQAGVQRVHRGDFGQPIRLASGDELQELGDEFNRMTSRLGGIYTDLAEQVETRSQQLVAAEKMVSVGFLAAGVAHEINNPLASIAFCAEALQRRLEPVMPAAGGDGEVITRYLGMIEQEAFRCKQITEQLLDYSRAGSGRWEPTDLGNLVGNVIELARHLPASRGKNLIFIPDGDVVATANSNELQGLVNNLVVNALENTDEGGTVQVAVRANGDAAELLVRDTGCGMGPDVLPHIFEPFFTRSKTGKGTGLGLFISQKIAAQHGGTLRAASDGPGRGSAFTLRFPLRRPDDADTGPPATVPFPTRTAAAA